LHPAFANELAIPKPNPGVDAVTMAVFSYKSMANIAICLKSI